MSVAKEPRPTEVKALALVVEQTSLIIGVGAVVVGGLAQARDQQVQAMLSYMQCPGSSPTGLDQKLLAPWTLSMRSKYLGGLFGNTIILATAFAFVRIVSAALTICPWLDYNAETADMLIGWPTAAWSAVLYFHQGNSVLAVQTLVDATSTWPEYLLGVMFVCLYCIAAPCFFLWLHVKVFRTLEFRKYDTQRFPSFLFFSRGVGPKHKLRPPERVVCGLR